jgi:DNA-directed RNA polymerase specialized sigma24 family protein
MTGARRPGGSVGSSLNEARKRRVAEGRHVPTPAAILDNGTATNGHRETGAAVAALALLPERQRLALFLRYYADLDYAGIAEATTPRSFSTARPSGQGQA